jgi:hypothetical protein
MELANLSAQARLILIRVKVERAKKHLRDLDAELMDSRNDSLYAILADVDLHSGQTSQKGKTLRRFPFNAMATAGDVIHNLRSALDHLAHQLVWVGSGHAPTRQVEFPIAKDMASYERDKVRKVEGMSIAAVKAIDALKPYRGGNEYLWRILELDNTDKHRTIFTVGQDTLFTADWIDAPFPEYLVKAGDPHFTGVFDKPQN